MASVLVPRMSIPINEAEQQFDLLFDEYFREEELRTYEVEADSPHGAVRLESGSAGEESDEAYIPDEQLDRQQVENREAICQVAHELRSLGDKYAERYGPNLARADTTLTTLFTKVTSLEYETFQNTLESLTTHDRNAADFVFMMYLSRHVVSKVGNVANKAKSFFRRYIGSSYIPAMAEAGGVREYVEQ